jgi:hypothetical protein
VEYRLDGAFDDLLIQIPGRFFLHEQSALGWRTSGPGHPVAPDAERRRRSRLVSVISSQNFRIWIN